MHLRVTLAGMMRQQSWRRSSGSYRSWYKPIIDSGPDLGKLVRLHVESACGQTSTAALMMLRQLVLP